MATLQELLGDAYNENMTIADINKAIADKKLADLSSGQYVSVGKLNDFESRMKKAEQALKDKMTEEEKAQAEMQKREEYYKALEKENMLNKFTAKLSKSIKDETVLAEVANLYAEGKYAEAIDKQNEYIAKSNTELEKTIKSNLMKENPQATAQKGKGGITKEDFDKMGVQERTKLYNEQPEIYKQLNN